MTEDSGSNGVTGKADHAAPSTTEELARLRTLLVGEELRRLDDLQQRLEDPARRTEDVGEVLPAAVRARMAQDDRLARALGPTIEDSFQASVRRNPQGLADAIAPIMGPAIRKSIIQAISGMVQSLNHALEQSLSPQGLKWRVEAMRTGKPFAEVVLLHTLVYRVEQVFLIHRETGLLLQHVTASQVQETDADMVSGMLTAIQDFVRDSFGETGDGGLQTMQVGERMVWVEQGADAVLACVIRGNAHPQLRVVLGETLEGIHLEQRQALTAFEGDSVPFETVRPVLEECLQSQFKSKPEDKPETKARSKKEIFVWIAAGLLLCAALAWAGLRWHEARRWQAFVERVAAAPGMVVIQAQRHDDGWRLSGLRDPLAPDPSPWLAEEGLSAATVTFEWEPYLSFVPAYSLQRARQILAPPAAVDLTLQGSTLTAAGSASHAWLAAARRAGALPGVTDLDLSAVVDEDRLQLQRLIGQLEGTKVPFDAGSAEVSPRHRHLVRRVARQVIDLLAQAAAVEQALGVNVVGHTDASGSPDRNRQLSQARAEHVLQVLIDVGVPAASLRSRSAGILAPDVDDDGALSRRVSFEVVRRD